MDDLPIASIAEPPQDIDKLACAARWVIRVAGMGYVSTWEGKTETMDRFQGVETKAVKEGLAASATEGNGGQTQLKSTSAMC